MGEGKGNMSGKEIKHLRATKHITMLGGVSEH